VVLYTSCVVSSSEVMIRTMYFYLVVFMRREINQVLVGWGMGPMGRRFGPFLYSQMAPFGSRMGVLD
jgi:hypothetical protein